MAAPNMKMGPTDLAKALESDPTVKMPPSGFIDRNAIDVNEDLLKHVISNLGARVSVDVLESHLMSLYEMMPHRPRSASIRSIMEYAGIPVPAASTAGSDSGDDDSMGEEHEEEEMEDDPPLEDVRELDPSSAVVPAEPAIRVKQEMEVGEADIVSVVPPTKRIKKEARTETASKTPKAIEAPSEKGKAPTETGKKAPSEAESSSESGKAPRSEAGKAPTSESGKAPTSESGKAPPSEAGTGPTTKSGKGPASESGKGPTSESGKGPTSESGKGPTTKRKARTETPTKAREAPAKTREAPTTETREAPATETREAPTTETREAATTETREAPTTETREAATTETREALPVRKRVKDPQMLKLKHVLEDGVKRKKCKHPEAGVHDGAATPTSTISTAASTYDGGNAHVVLALDDGNYECQGCGLMGDLATITSVECNARRLAKMKELEKLRELTLALQEMKRQRLYEREMDLAGQPAKAPTVPSTSNQCTDNLETQVWMEDSQPPWDPACKALSFDHAVADAPESESESAEPLMHVGASKGVLRRSGRGIAKPKIEIDLAKPEVAPEATKPKIARATTKPDLEIATKATKPEIATTATKAKIATTATEPKIATTATEPKIATTATEPEIATTARGSKISKASKGESAKGLKADGAGDALPEKPACMDKIPPSINPKDQKRSKQEPDEEEAAGEGDDVDGDALTEAPEDEENDAPDDDGDDDDDCDDADGSEAEEDEEETASKPKVMKRPAAKVFLIDNGEMGLSGYVTGHCCLDCFHELCRVSLDLCSVNMIHIIYGSADSGVA
ncbi:unnamed protein product [Symbiodinium sp. CCMP2456]|nr:unnamed protein product [Symbiodinium sp. CCMP2456]